MVTRGEVCAATCAGVNLSPAFEIHLLNFVNTKPAAMQENVECMSGGNFGRREGVCGLGETSSSDRMGRSAGRSFVEERHHTAGSSRQRPFDEGSTTLSQVTCKTRDMGLDALYNPGSCYVR